MIYFLGICKEKGQRVSESHALGYALDRVLNNNKDKKEFIEWFYSGNWIKISEGDD